MRKALLSWLSVGAVAIGGLWLAGCGTNTKDTTSNRPPASELQEGLTILDQVPGWGMNAAFKKDGRVLYFETRVGSLKPEVYREAFPDEPAEETDALVTDESGRVVYVQQGGDDVVDQSWHKPLEAEASLPIADPERRAQDFKLVEQAGLAFEKLTIPAEFKADLHAMKNARLAATHFEASRLAMASKSEAAKAVGETGYGTPGSNDFHIHGKWLIWGVAEHTASYSNINGVSKNSCNHGTCASSMSHWCNTTAKSASAVHYYKTDCSSTGCVGTGNCTTGYNWNSTGGGHNCHDDTVRALWGFKHGSQGGSTSGVCSNGASHWYGPSCSTSSW
jgi:hypothetical protein